MRGEQLTSSVGLWTGTTPLVFSYRWLRCPASGGQASGSDCTAITGATGTQYELTADDVGRRIRVQVTARNTLGSATATSDATALVTATATPPPPPPTTLPPGAIRLADGKYSIPVTSVSEPQRLVAQQIVFTPNPVRSRQRPLELRVRVLDTRGYVVRDALVFARSTPLLTSAPGEQRTATGRMGAAPDDAPRRLPARWRPKRPVLRAGAEAVRRPAGGRLEPAARTGGHRPLMKA